MIRKAITVVFKNKVKPFILVFCFLSMVGWSWNPLSLFSFLTPHSSSVGSRAWVNEKVKVITSQANNLNSNVLTLSLKAYDTARKKGLDDKQLLTIIDYSKPSTERRLWVVDLKNDKVLFNTWVAHGKNSGTVMATSFSNQRGSLKSSVGVYLTDEPYVGGDGYSLRLTGLEQKFNNNAYPRDVVMHGAWYVSPDVIKTYGALGRSWGCPAVSEKLAQPIINTIKNKTLIVVYANDQTWLRESTFLNG